MNTAYSEQRNYPQPPARYANPENAYQSAFPNVFDGEANVQASAQVSSTSDSFSKTSAAFVVLGLLLIGGAISPLLALFEASAVAKYAIGVAYIVLACVVVAWIAGKMFARSQSRFRYVRAMRVAVLVVGELVLAAFTASSYAFQYSWEATALVLAALLLVLRFAPVQGLQWGAYYALRVNEIVVLCALAPAIAFTGFYAEVSPITIACYGAVLATATALVSMRAVELARGYAHPATRNGGLLACLMLAYLLTACSFVEGCTPLESPYAQDVVLMLGAAACAALGFGCRESALRRTGLAIALCTIVKMVTVDTIGFDPLPKAMAYIAGGVACFVIGGMYSYAVKRIGSDLEKRAA